MMDELGVETLLEGLQWQSFDAIGVNMLEEGGVVSLSFTWVQPGLAVARHTLFGFKSCTCIRLGLG